MQTFFVLTLMCLSCKPAVIFQIHDIPAYSGGSFQWSELYCEKLGDILSGELILRNQATETPYMWLQSKKFYISFTCAKETAYF